MPVYEGNNIQLLSAIDAYNLGYLTSAEYISTASWELSKLRKGLYVSRMIYVNGAYRGTTRHTDTLTDIVERLRLL